MEPNTWHYFITETQTGRKVPVRFEPLTPAYEALGFVAASPVSRRYILSAEHARNLLQTIWHNPEPNGGL